MLKQLVQVALAHPRRLLAGGSLVFFILGGTAYFLRQYSQSQSNILTGSLTTKTLRGTAVEGAVLNIVNYQDQQFTLQIQDSEPDPMDPEGEVRLYTVNYQNPATSQWENICKPDAKGLAKAIPLSGRWDDQGNHIKSDKVTFSCTSGVAAKCIRWGYKPWKTVQGKSLENFYQACTRMARADYCGKGVPHTQDGTAVDVYDRIGIQKRVAQTGMKFEAAWSPTGAVAISRTRYPEGYAQIQKECPERLKPFQNEALINRDLAKTIPMLQQYAPEALIFNDSFDLRGK